MYILGTGSTHDNQELRWAMRSIEKYGKNIDRVFVVGADPGWLSDQAIYIPCEDKFDYKHKNMLYKIQYIAENTDISDTFLTSSDDIFVLKPFDADTWPLYFCGMLPEIEPNVINPKAYIRQLWLTRRYLSQHKLPTYRFAQHCLHKMSKQTILNNRSIIMDAYKEEFGVEPNCLINNLMIKQGQWEKKAHIDNKLSVTSKEENALGRLKKDINEFSVGDGALNEPTMNAINQLYPNKSKWEK